MVTYRPQFYVGEEDDLMTFLLLEDDNVVRANFQRLLEKTR